MRSVSNSSEDLVPNLLESVVLNLVLSGAGTRIPVVNKSRPKYDKLRFSGYFIVVWY